MTGRLKSNGRISQGRMRNYDSAQARSSSRQATGYAYSLRSTSTGTDRSDAVPTPSELRKAAVLKARAEQFKK